jgi:hypothetical protein
MNCEVFQTAAEDLERPGAVDDSTREALLTHAEGCLACARQLDHVRKLSAALRALGRADESKRAGEHLEAELLGAFRAQAQWRSRRSRLRWWMAAAAVVALALAAGIGWRGAREPSGGQAAKPLRFAAPVVSGASQAPPAAKPSRPAEKRAVQPVRTVPRGPVLLARERPEELTGFLPLPYADPQAPLGSGEVVRIRLSESSLALLGVPVSEGAGSRPITADVVVGEDGVARAIRFVSESSNLSRP